MKKSTGLLLFLALMLTLLVAPQVMAMEMIVENNGAVRFYDDRILGDEDGDEDKDEDRSDDEREDEDRSNDDDDNETEEKRTEIKTEIKTISPYQRKQFEFKREDDGRYKVEIQDGKSKVKIESRNIKQAEVVEADGVDVTLPIKFDEKAQKERQLELIKKRLENTASSQQLTEEEKNKLAKEKQEQLAKYYQKIATERKQRQLEKVEIKSNEGSESAFVLKSNNVEAALRGANFNYDQETGLVSVITPSGQEHTLTHLPDEAIAQMTAKGFFIDSNQVVAIESTDQETVAYKVPSKKTKKLFGVFDRQVDAEVVLDDLTGEVIEQEVEPTSFWSRFLNRFSY